MKAKEEAMRVQFEKLNAELNELSTLGEELERLQEDLKAAVATAEQVHLAVEQIKRELREPDPVTLLQEAAVPPEVPKRSVGN